MWGFEYLAAPMKEMPYVNQLLTTWGENHFYAIVAGAVISAVIQSSSATTGIVMGFLLAGTMELDTGVAIILGANIGTCVDALFAGFVSRSKEARLTAYAHTWLNVLGVIAFYLFIDFTFIGQQLSGQPNVNSLISVSSSLSLSRFWSFHLPIILKDYPIYT